MPFFVVKLSNANKGCIAIIQNHFPFPSPKIIRSLRFPEVTEVSTKGGCNFQSGRIGIVVPHDVNDADDQGLGVKFVSAVTAKRLL